MDGVTLIRFFAGIVAVVLVGLIVARRKSMAPSKH